VFHEVSEVKDKREVIREALRVVKEGGCFALEDLFLDKRLYGATEQLLATVKGRGIAGVQIGRTSDTSFIPGALRVPFMVGTMAVISGRKWDRQVLFSARSVHASHIST
jgi:hypothetical protein